MSAAVVYDAAVLIGADRDDRTIWSRHRRRLESDIRLLVPAPVVVQVSRSPKQVQLRRFLSGCVIVPLTESGAHEAGRLLALSKTSDVVDAVVVAIAIHHKATTIITSDLDDLRRLVAASGHSIRIDGLGQLAKF